MSRRLRLSIRALLCTSMSSLPRSPIRILAPTLLYSSTKPPITTPSSTPRRTHRCADPSLPSDHEHDIGACCMPRVGAHLSCTRLYMPIPAPACPSARAQSPLWARFQFHAILPQTPDHVVPVAITGRHPLGLCDLTGGVGRSVCHVSASDAQYASCNMCPVLASTCPSARAPYLGDEYSPSWKFHTVAGYLMRMSAAASVRQRFYDPRMGRGGEGRNVEEGGKEVELRFRMGTSALRRPGKRARFVAGRAFSALLFPLLPRYNLALYRRGEIRRAARTAMACAS
ncbi:hypothetical protein B0H19DRAFT_1374833 [Mycena capillaripes]|nr:hypothetical protein B0H19DRAFT_1374833 [Mycena capillaripes]